MKTLNRKSIVVLVLSFIFALSMFAFASTVKPAKAEGELITVTEADFQILEEASVRIKGTKDVPGSGIRFRAKVSEGLMNALLDEKTDKAYMGFLITTKEIFNAYDGEDYINGLAKKINIKVSEDTFYDDEFGNWYVNGALNNIKVGNIDREFTAVAYVYDGVKNHYSELDNDFGRTYKSVIQKAFIDGYDAKLLKEAAWMADDAESETPGFISQMQSGDVTVAIEDSKDLYNLSNSVANNKTFENAKFVITNDLEVDYDFAPIDSGLFAGSITASEAKTVQVYNNRGLTSILSSGDPIANLTVKNDKNLFDVTDKSEKLFYYEKNGYKYATKTSVDAMGKTDNFIGFSGDVLQLPKYTSNAATPILTVNYTANQLAEYKSNYDVKNEGKELAIKFTYYAPNSFSNNCNTHPNNLFKIAGFGGETAIHSIDYGRWMTMVVSVEDFSTIYIRTNLDDLPEDYAQTNPVEYAEEVAKLNKIRVLQNFGEFQLTMSGIGFIEWDFANDYMRNFNHDFIASQREVSRFLISSDTTVDYVEGDFSKTITTSITNPSTQVTNTYTAPDNNSINYNGGAVVAASSTTARGLTIKMPYTGEQYREIATDKEKEGVEIIFRVSRVGPSVSYETGTLGTILAGHSWNDWITVVLPIDTFIGTFGRTEKTWSEEDQKWSDNEHLFVADETSNKVVVRPESYLSGRWEFSLASIKLIDWDFTKDIANKGSVKDFIPNANNAFKFTSSGRTSKYYTADELKGLEGVRNNIGFNEDAVAFENFGSGTTIYVEMPYIKDEYQILYNKGEFNAVRVTYLLTREKTGVTNRPYQLNNSVTTTNVLSAAGYASYGRNTWTSAMITAQDFLDSFQSATNLKASYLLSNAYYSGSDNKPSFYLAEISLVKNWNFETDVIDKGAPVFFTATESATSDFSMSGNAVTGVTLKTSYIAPGQLPAQDTYISNTTGLVTSTVDIANTANYEGGFVKFEGLSKNKYLYLNYKNHFNYTLDELKILVDTGKISGTVKATYLYVGSTSQHGSTATLTLKMGGLVKYDVVTKELTLEEFLAIGLSSDKLMLIRTLNSGSAAANYYLGNIEFIPAVTAE